MVRCVSVGGDSSIVNSVLLVMARRYRKRGDNLNASKCDEARTRFLHTTLILAGYRW